MSTAESIQSLEDEIEDCRACLAKVQFKGSRYFLDQTVFRYLWGAVASADVVLLAAKAGHSSGTESLKRHLHESLLDLAYILSDADPELCAAKTVLADLDDWKEIWNLHPDVVAASPSEPIPPVPPEWNNILSKSVDDVVKDLDKFNGELAGRSDLFAQAHTQLKQQAHWHWSGKSRHRMIETLNSRGQLDNGSAAIARTLTKLYNLGTHASPSWSTLNFEVTGEEQVHQFPDPSESEDSDIERLVTQTASLLKGVRSFVETSGISFKASR